jgi:hypothetical protein
MISPWGTRGKGIGLADRPVVPAVPRPREPWTGRLDLGGPAAQDDSMVLDDLAGRRKYPSSAIHPMRPLSRTSFQSCRATAIVKLVNLVMLHQQANTFLPFLGQMADRRTVEPAVVFFSEPPSGMPKARELKGGLGGAHGGQAFLKSCV